MPREAKEFSAAGYEAFVNYWFDAHNYGMATGDTMPMQGISMDKCGICVERAKTIKRAYANSAWVVGGEIQLDEFYSPLRKDVQSLYQAVIQFRESPSQLYAADGKPMPDQDFEGKTHNLNAYASYTQAGGWKMAAIQGDD